MNTQMMRHSYSSFAAICIASIALTFLSTGWMFAEEGNSDEAFTIQRDFSPLTQADSGKIVSYADVLEKITPAVVSIHTSHVMEVDPRREALEEMMRRYFGMPPRSSENVPEPEAEPEPSGLGSGFIISENGYILTNNHVVKGPRDEAPSMIIVKLNDGRELDAELVGADAETDVAVLKIDANELPFATLGDSSQLRIGDIVFAMGSPLGIGLTVTQGIVSAKNRTDLGILPGGYESFIQTDAAINRGNSGGPLVDGLGRVVGINSAIISDSYFGGSIGIGFAIPIDLAASVMKSLVEGGEVQRGFIGIRPEPLTRKLAEAFGLDSTKGAVVARVTPGLPADEAGLRHGDVILTVNDERVDSVNDLIYLISRLNPGTTAELGISRAGKAQFVDVVLGDRSSLIEQTFSQQSAKAPQELLKGITVKPVTDKLRADFNIPEDVSGLWIESITENSPYRGEFLPGMVLIEINGVALDSVEAGRNALKEAGKVNALYLYFDRQYTYTTLTVEE